MTRKEAEKELVALQSAIEELLDKDPAHATVDDFGVVKDAFDKANKAIAFHNITDRNILGWSGQMDEWLRSVIRHQS